MEDLTGKAFWLEEDVIPDHQTVMKQALQRLLQHEPWQYVGGIADFYGLKFQVNSSVLIPRPETEELVYMALDLHHTLKLPSVIDIGTGSGAIAIVLAKKGNWTSISAIDVSSDALHVAKQNAQTHDASISFSQMDFLDEASWPTLPKVSLVVSNPPYILREESVTMDQNVLSYEPHQALFVSKHALEFYDGLSRFVVGFQPSGCRLLVEINERFGAEVLSLFQENGMEQVVLFQDLQGKDRFVAGISPVSI
jgi:release factor glutamine methyltransferase